MGVQDPVLLEALRTRYPGGWVLFGIDATGDGVGTCNSDGNVFLDELYDSWADLLAERGVDHTEAVFGVIEE